MSVRAREDVGVTRSRWWLVDGLELELLRPALGYLAWARKQRGRRQGNKAGDVDVLVPMTPVRWSSPPLAAPSPCPPRLMQGPWRVHCVRVS